VRQEMDFGDVVKLVVDRWDQLPQANGIEVLPERTENSQELDQSWFHAMRRILVIKNLWEAKAGAMVASDAERTGGLGTEENGIPNGFAEPGMQPAWEFGGVNLDLLDDIWMRDMLGGNYDFNF
jgi:hypothetical protein